MAYCYNVYIYMYIKKAVMVGHADKTAILESTVLNLLAVHTVYKLIQFTHNFYMYM